MKKKISALLLCCCMALGLLAVLTFSAGAAAVTGIQTAGRTKIAVGESVKWTAMALPEGVQTAFRWTAGNPGVATVDQNGRITSHKAGQCHITVTASNGVKKTVLLTVEEVAVTGLQTAGKTKIAVGESVTWTATPVPANATNRKVTWTAGNPGVATVDQNGRITGRKPGLCNITMTAANGVKKTVLVQVRETTRQEMAYAFACQKIRNIGTRSDQYRLVLGDISYPSVPNVKLTYAFFFDEVEQKLGIMMYAYPDNLDDCFNSYGLFLYPDTQTTLLYASLNSSVIDIELSGDLYAPTYDGENLTYEGTTQTSQYLTEWEKRKYADDLWDSALKITNGMLLKFESDILAPGGYRLEDFGFRPDCW